MRVLTRIYKQFDPDLLALDVMGYPIPEMMRLAVSAIAHGQPIHFYIDQPSFFDLNNKKNVKKTFTIDNKDTVTIALLKRIKHGYISSFCKAALRNCLVQQNICAFFSTPDMIQYQIKNLQGMNLNAFYNLKPLSTLKEILKKEQVQSSLPIPAPVDTALPPVGPILFPGYAQNNYVSQSVSLPNTGQPADIEIPLQDNIQIPETHEKPVKKETIEIQDEDLSKKDMEAISSTVQGMPINNSENVTPINDDIIEAADNDDLLDMFMKL